MATDSKRATKQMKKSVKGVLNYCKEILSNAPHNGCVINTINKKLSALR